MDAEIKYKLSIDEFMVLIKYATFKDFMVSHNNFSQWSFFRIGSKTHVNIDKSGHIYESNGKKSHYISFDKAVSILSIENHGN